jgi:PAS domain S-box-containing protein
MPISPHTSPLIELLERSPALYWTADRSLRLTSVTRPGLPAIDPQSQGIVGSPLAVLFPPLVSDHSPIAAHLRALEGTASRFELAMNGREWVGRVEPLRGSFGDISGVSGIAFDNTDRAFAESSLRLSEQSYRSLIEDAPFAICRATVSGQLLQVNRAMVEMLHYESEPDLLLCGLRSEIFLKPETYEEFVSNLHSTNSLQGFESTWRRHDGKSISVSLAGRATRNNLGQIAYLEILGENINERKQLEHQLRQAQKMQAVGQLAGGIAHDFNNLLTVIAGQVQLALAELPDGDPLRNRLDEVEKAADRAAKLTRQLLAFARIRTLEDKVLDLNAVVTGMTGMLSRLIGKTIELNFTPAEKLGHISADPAQLEQVLMNLVLNAKDATLDGGSVTITTENSSIPPDQSTVVPAGEYVSLTVSDTGHGMSAETQARIFEPFFTTKKPGQGTGLGLATVYSIVKQSKGYIVAESEVGVGSRFTIYFPRVAAPARKSPLASPPKVQGGSETILLAEDEESIRKFAAAFLSGLGYRVLTAADGVEARVLANSHGDEIGLLITDIVMPRLGGRELAEELRLTFPDLKILFMSGYAGNAAIGQAMNDLNAPLLQKPFSSMPAFAKTVRDVLDQPTAPGSGPSLPRSV